MFDFIINALFELFINITNFILTPINSAFNTFFPDLSSYVSTFSDFVENYITPSINYFVHILPPNSRSLLLVYLGLLVVFYTITLIAHFIIKVIEIIKNVQIW